MEARTELSDAEKRDRMKTGVDALFDLWAALVAMRAEAVAGRSTEDLVEDLRDGILEQFVFTGKKCKAKVSQNDMEDMIYDFVGNEMSTVLEDGSVEQVADYAFQLFRTLSNSDVSVFDKVVAAAEKRRKVSGPKPKFVKEKKTENVAIVANDNNKDEVVDEDDSEGESGEDQEGDEEGEEKEEGTAKKKEEDDDWTVVGKGGKKK